MRAELSFSVNWPAYSNTLANGRPASSCRRLVAQMTCTGDQVLGDHSCLRCDWTDKITSAGNEWVAIDPRRNDSGCIFRGGSRSTPKRVEMLEHMGRPRILGRNPSRSLCFQDKPCCLIPVCHSRLFEGGGRVAAGRAPSSARRFVVAASERLDRTSRRKTARSSQENKRLTAKPQSTSERLMCCPPLVRPEKDGEYLREHLCAESWNAVNKSPETK